MSVSNKRSRSELNSDDDNDDDKNKILADACARWNALSTAIDSPLPVPDEEKKGIIADNDDKKDIVLSLKDLSREQAEVLDRLQDGCHVTVRAFPGCGKSTLIGHIVTAFPHKNIMIISYNTKLVRSTRRMVQRCAALTSRNPQTSFVCVKTYHGLMSSLVKYGVHNDTLFNEALDFKDFVQMGREWNYRDIDIIVVDEKQDCRRRYFMLLIHLFINVCTVPKGVQLVLLGDEMQALYEFFPINKADARYLTCAEQILAPVNITNRPWFHQILPVSFRATPQIATVINALVPGRNMISGQRFTYAANWVTLYIADIYKDAAGILFDVIRREAGPSRKYGNILVLCNSLNETSFAVHLVDMLVQNNIPVHVGRSGILSEGGGGGSNSSAKRHRKTINNDDYNNDEENLRDTSQNKVRFMTDVGSKGLEAEIVIVLSQSELLSEEFVTKPKYVALTRSFSKLYIIQHNYYSSQAQLDDLLANPNITQRELRVILMRPLAATLGKRRSQQQKNTILSKGGLQCSTLFSFVDVTHTEELLEHIDCKVIAHGFSAVPDGCDDPAEEARRSEEEEDDDSFDENTTTPGAEYMTEMTISFDKNQTFVSVLSICSLAIQLALETAYTHRTPILITRILKKIHTVRDAISCIMQERILAALDAIFALQVPSLNNNNNTVIGDDERFTCAGIMRNMRSFASLATVLDASHGYRELFHAIPSYDFIESDHVFRRLAAAYDALFVIIPPSLELIWHTELVGRFQHNGEALQMKAQPAIASVDGTFIVCFTSNVATSHEDRLMAIATSLTSVAANDERNRQEIPNTYILNLFDASIEQVTLLSSPSPMCDDSSSTTGFNLSNRRNVCMFLDLAVQFKLWHEVCERTLSVNTSDSEQHCLEDQTFINNTLIDVHKIMNVSGKKANNCA